jgi:hypothetical protein
MNIAGKAEIYGYQLGWAEFVTCLDPTSRLGSNILEAPASYPLWKLEIPR